MNPEEDDQNTEEEDDVTFALRYAKQKLGATYEEARAYVGKYVRFVREASGASQLDMAREFLANLASLPDAPEMSIDDALEYIQEVERGEGDFRDVYDAIPPRRMRHAAMPKSSLLKSPKRKR